MREQPAYVSGALVAGMPAEVISAVLRAGLEAEMRRRGLSKDQQRRVRAVQAAIHRAAHEWLPDAAPGSLTHAAHARVSDRDAGAGPVPPSVVDLMTTAEAAEEAHMSPARMQQLAREGVIGRKVGRDFVITRSELEMFLADRDDVA